MANDIQNRVGQILGSDSARALAGTAVGEALKALGGQRSSNGAGGPGPGKGLSGVRGLAAGAGAAAVAPLAAKGIGKLIRGGGAGALTTGPKKLVEGAASKVGDTVSGKVHEKVDEAGGPSGILKDTVKSALPFGGGGDGGGSKGGVDGVGKGRRMPIQQSVDIGLPIETVYNQWTQFEEWPKFMHRVTRVSQEDPCTVSFAAKIWGKTKEFTAKIETQRPNERIKWRVSDGMTHTGVVTFHELGPNLTRVLLSFDVDPGSLIEKFARGARHVKRAARADMHRFVAFIDMLEHETGAWRGLIEDGELVKDHDPGYDKKREYGSADELTQDSDGDQDSDEDEPSGRNGGEPRRRAQRATTRSRSPRQSGGSSRAQSRSGGSASRSTSAKSSGSRSSSGRSSSARSASPRSSGSSGKSRSSGASNGSSGSGRSSSGRASGGSKSSGQSSGRARATSRSSSAEHQGRQRSRSTGRN